MGVVAMATNNIFAEPASSHSDSQKAIVIGIAIVASAIGLGCLLYGVYRMVHKCLRIRRRLRRLRVLNIEEGSIDEPIPLQDLPPVRNAGRFVTTNPQFSTNGLPPPRSMNEFTMALSSNPPSQANLDTAKNALHSHGSARETMPATMAGPSTQGLPEEPPRSLGQPRPRPPRPIPSSRRRGMVLESRIEERAAPELLSFPVTSPRIETMPKGIGVGIASLTESHSGPGLATASFSRSADGTHEHGNQSLPLSYTNNQGGDNEYHAQDEHRGPNNNATDRSPSSEAGLQGTAGNWSSSTAMAEAPEPDQNAQEPGKDNDPQNTLRSYNRYGCLHREFTHASLVPQPLVVPVRGNNTVHHVSSPVTTTAPTPLNPTPASAADVDDSPVEPEIETQRPRSFLILAWPPPDLSRATFDNALIRQAQWHTPPSDEIIERSRQAREQMEWEEEAKKYILQKAKDANEQISEEELARRVRRMYERSSRFRLEATTLQPPDVGPSSPRGIIVYLASQQRSCSFPLGSFAVGVCVLAGATFTGHSDIYDGARRFSRW
ncbi:hypothetical protein E0Z10_g10235 [Xylaria hypoxylon]|uniref:Uncharacterized protein n=1 Tax=Xylaria hypoxylon TaxID=37992 RepID=A0A4Z0YF60_9PEZI|nr:hypothetical protein E0Z10_g10235 [Xylaria hypoxylon]